MTQFVRKIWRSINPSVRIKINSFRGKGPKYLKKYDEHKCLFIHIPKTAGTSIGEIVAGTGRPGHWSAMEFFYLNKHKFDEYYKFCFVRNPWDRLVSSFFYLKKGGKSKRDAKFAQKHIDKYETFNDFVIALECETVLQKWIHFLPQTHFITGNNQELLVDYVGRFESIEEDFNVILNKIGIENISLEKKNQSVRDDYKTYYNDRSRKVVEKLYAEDINLFNYSF